MTSDGSKFDNPRHLIKVEDLLVKGMMVNHSLAKAIGDAGWGMLTSMLKYKAARAGKGYVEVNRYFPSSKTCSSCLHVKVAMPLNIRSWRCDHCGILHDRDINAAQNIRDEAQRMIFASQISGAVNISAGAVETANGGAVSQAGGRKSSVLLAPLKLEAPPFTAG